jgi:hypothetical protein
MYNRDIMRALVATPLFVGFLLGACTEPNPGYEPPAIGGECTPGERLCSGADLLVCVGGEQPRFELERVCPAPAVCEQGACVASGETCQGTCDAGLVCTVFAVPGVSRLETYCVQPTGPDPGGQPCRDSEQCQTGLCVGGGRVPVCFQACTKSSECLVGLRCRDVSLTVDGVSGTLPACVP